ncbi:putative disease resistance protein At3g14460 [Solanum stenotomum]|uniref:putative disease resistance protein At3g14460 n=1 Tax=Solanum stenotomum TaxID=172797 RepID=UPI0020D04C23|nr:putative disease resistance protein At3g14460 [Solanum stenotomum]
MDISGLGLPKHFGSTKQETRTPSTSLVDESAIFGRQNDIADLIDRLLSEDASGGNLTVVPIVGMGGAGKTTLAKVVYNDEKVKNHFGLRVWYCVSEPYDVFRITKGLLQGVDSFDPKDDGNLDKLQIKLKESLKGKKFLVVLDDVWNDTYSEWESLRNVFVEGDMGSKIIVTTRKKSVAKMMCAKEVDHCTITVGTLSSEDSWALFKRHSLENRDHPELEEVGKKIADNCNGLPLALKAVAGTLRGKSKVEEWRNILRSEIWKQESCWNGILPALMLSYNDLPAHLKQCFAYCAIYPKNCPFSKDQVIHLWIANGFVKQFCSGNQCFLELRSRSLFEKVPESERKPGEFLMHDFVNDLAQIASSKLCIRLEENEGSDDMLEQSRHMSYSMGREGDFAKLKQLSKSGQLRTLLPVNIVFCFYQLSKRVLHNILPKLTSLRALSLSGYEIEEFPNDLFVKLKLLRFLDLSGTKIKRLPDSICALYNLETLLLSSCADLEELPLQMEKLINLRHLDLSNTFNSNLPHLDLSNTFNSKMLLHLSKLKSLQVLVGAKLRLGGLKMEDLGELENLYGSLSVLELQNVVDQREALKAKLKEKNHVENLYLEWSERSTANDSQTEIDILDGLRPHTNIKEVEITGYRGTKFSGTEFPSWLADPLFLKLVKLSLSNCKDCFSLPALGELPSLKILCIRGMHKITEVKEEFYRSSSSNEPSNSLEKLEFADMPEVTKEFYGSSSSKKPFNSLEKLEFKDMLAWKHWHVLGCGEFPKLEKLSIENCPKLMEKLPENLCSLTELIISECPQLNLDKSQLKGMKQIVELKIGDCNHLTLPFSILPSTLKKIRIYKCKELKLEMPGGEMSYCNMFLEDLTLQECVMSPDLFLPRARELLVEDCHNLTTFSIPTATETLTIVGCKDIEKLSVAFWGTQMTSLSIDVCENLKWLPERMQELLPSLKTLQLDNCPEIESFPQGGLPINLQVLEINSCKKLVNGRKESRLPKLRQLGIEHDGRDEEMEHWELPSSIQSLTIGNQKTLSSEDLKSLTSLEYLRIINLPQIKSLTALLPLLPGDLPLP